MVAMVCFHAVMSSRRAVPVQASPFAEAPIEVDLALCAEHIICEALG